jgi:hypothetical protein
MSSAESRRAAFEASRWVYAGPGWQEWVYSLASGFMLVQTWIGMQRAAEPGRAAAYYFQEPLVRGLQTTSLCINALAILVIGAWVVSWRKRVKWRWIVPALAGIGFILIGTELAMASSIIGSRNDVLAGLPVQFVQSMGVVGGTFHLAFLVAKLPDKTLGAWWSLLIKFLLILCLWPAQMIVWELIAK